MQPQTVKNSRSEQARINGAKSRGPKSKQGLHNSRTASIQHGLFAQQANLLPTVDEPIFAAFRQTVRADWNPANPYLAAKVDDLIAYRWELDRLRAVRRHFLARIFNDVAATHADTAEEFSVVAETEIRATTDSDTLARLDLRIRRNNLEISRLERDLIRLQKHFVSAGPSQIPLETKESEPERTQPTQHGPIAWAEENFDIALDLHQADLLAATDNRILLNAARYSGKTTALALRALYESAVNPAARIVCLSPNGDLMDKVKESAAVIDHEAANITDKLTSNATLVLVDDAAALPAGVLDNLPVTTTVILASTPQGAAGYFYNQWTGSAWRNLFAPAAHCDRIGEDLKHRAAQKLSELAYLQEFECQFLSQPQPRCRLLPLAQ